MGDVVALAAVRPGVSRGGLLSPPKNLRKTACEPGAVADEVSQESKAEFTHFCVQSDVDWPPCGLVPGNLPGLATSRSMRDMSFPGN